MGRNQRGIAFISIGARITTPELLRHLSSHAARECSEFILCFLDLCEIVNLHHLEGKDKDPLLLEVQGRCGHLLEQASDGMLLAPRVMMLSDLLNRQAFGKYFTAVEAEYSRNDHFRNHVRNQIYRNLYPVLKRRQIRKSDKILTDLADYLLFEIALKLFIAGENIADIEYAREPEMQIIESIYAGQYPQLQNLATRRLELRLIGMDLRLESIYYSYPDSKFEIRDLSLRIPAGIRFGIVGPNGSGKTTVLKLIAGHLQPCHGSILYGYEDIGSLPPGARPTATVFQDHALFPNMTALENVSFGLTYRSQIPRKAAQHVAMEWLNEFGLTEYAESKPPILSIGHQQRVAIARTLAVRPAILLLDEPTASIDSQQREYLASVLRSANEAGWTSTIILVSHDIDFALSVCDQLAILDDGSLLAEGDVPEIFMRPPTIKVARYLGWYNIVVGKLGADGSFVDENSDFRLVVHEPSDKVRGKRAALLIRPDSIRLERPNHQESDSFSGLVTEIVQSGFLTTVNILVGKNIKLRCEVSSSNEGLVARKGAQVQVYFPRESITVIPAD